VTSDGLEGLVDDLTDSLITKTTVSPNVADTGFTTISPTGTTQYLGKAITPVCMNGTPYNFFVKRGSVNKLLMYYQGGGACWDALTCGLPTCDTTASSSDNPGGAPSGFFDLSNPNNPFKDWNIVFVSYCSCDVHFGDAAQDYTPTLHVEHRGYDNSRIAEKWAREHFVSPDQIFVTGSSAGAYGAWFNAPLHEMVWPASRFQVLADAGNGVITQDFLQNNFGHWDFVKNIPSTIPGVLESITNGTGIVGYTKAVTSFFPKTRWAEYATAFDGGSGGPHLVDGELPVQRGDAVAGPRARCEHPVQLPLLHRHRLPAHDVVLPEGLQRHDRRRAAARRLGERDAHWWSGLDQRRGHRRGAAAAR
jgi:hypothetical protein